MSESVQYRVLKNGLNVREINSYETDFLYDEIFERKVYVKHGIELQADACVLDVGANIGLFAQFVAIECPSAKVFSFEPAPQLFEHLLANVADLGERVTCLEKGLSDEIGTELFTYYPGYSILSGFAASDEQSSDLILSGMPDSLRENTDPKILRAIADQKLTGKVQFDCDLSTVSTIISEQNLKRIDLLKVDAEGSEVRILNGIQKEHWSLIHQIVIEVHDTSSMLADVLRTLEVNGFSCVVENTLTSDRAGVANIYAKRQTEKSIQESSERERPSYQVCVASSYTIDAIADSVAYWGELLRWNIDLTFVQFDNILQTLLNPDGEFRSNRSGVNVIYMRFGDWLRDQSVQPSKIDQLLFDRLEEFTETLIRSVDQMAVPILVVVSPESPSGLLQDRGALVDELFGQLERVCSGSASIQVMKSAHSHEDYEIEEFFSDLGDQLGQVPYVGTYYDFLGTLLVRRLHALNTRPIKVMALDCDNTIWGGVCAELESNELDLSGRFGGLQRLAKEKSQQGVLTCLFSKNSADDVWGVFEARPDSPLQREQITDSRINWLPKSKNIADVAHSISLGVDAFVFIDDNEIEREEVRRNAPEALVIDWPLPSGESACRHLWFVDRFSLTKEDIGRVAAYQENSKREDFRNNSADYDEFLAGLELNVQLELVADDTVERVAQLSNKTNQFNLTTLKWSVSDVNRLRKKRGYRIFTISVNDRFGDYGLVGVIGVKKKRDLAKIESMLMSCRVLGRGVEYELMSILSRRLKKWGCKSVRLPFVPSARNEPARQFVSRLVGESINSDVGKNQAFELSIGELIKAASGKSVKASPQARTRMESNATVDESTQETRYRESVYIKIASDLSSGRRISDAIAEFRLNGVVGVTEAVTGTNGNSERTKQRSTNSQEPDKRLISDLVEEVRSLFARELGLKASAIPTRENLKSVINDSLKTVQLTVALDQKFKGVPPTLLFSHYTIEAIARFLADQSPGLTLQQPEAVPVSSSSAPTDVALRRDNSFTSTPPVRNDPTSSGERSTTTVGENDIGIIQMHCRVPQADSPEALWTLLQDSKTTFDKIPSDRWDVNRFFDEEQQPGKHYSEYGSFLSDVRRFDAAFFQVSPKEAAWMDPQQRIFLELVWGLLERAGYTPTTLGKRTGVYAGVISNDYAALVSDASLGGGDAYRSNEYYQIPNRVSYSLGFTGPSMAIDTACSGSGAAIHLACKSLLANECDAAIAGGINLILHPSRFIQHSQMKTLTSADRCRPFAEAADGILLGEGAAVLLLKRLRDCERDGDSVLAVIKGSALTGSGQTRGFTVPDPQAQAETISTALTNAKIEPSTIDYIEAHGTGTSLGDPIEIAGLDIAFHKGSEEIPSGTCPIGSLKGNIGHLESAAAVAGIVKVVLQMQAERLLPSLGITQTNSKINFSKTPFFVQREAQKWLPKQPPGRLRAGVSSFGAGGVNAHLVVEQATTQADALQDSANGTSQIVILSARTASALDRCAENLHQWVGEHLKSGAALVRLGDIAHTLRVGRVVMSERLAVLVGSLSELHDVLTIFLDGRKSDPRLFVSSPSDSNSMQSVLNDTVEIADFVQSMWRKEKFDFIARYWVNGGDLDWCSLSQNSSEVSFRRICLPTYPFEGEAHWIGSPEQESGELPSNINDPRLESSGASSLPLHQADLLATQWRLSQLPAVNGHEFDLPTQTIIITDDSCRGLANSLAPVSTEATRVVDVSRLSDVKIPTRGTIRVVDLTAVLANAEASSSLSREWLMYLQQWIGEAQHLEIAVLVSGLIPLEGAMASMSGASMACFLPVIGQEIRHLSTVVIDIDHVELSNPQFLQNTIQNEFAAGVPEPRVAYREGIRYVPTLTVVSDQSTAVDLSSDDVILITGSTGALGSALIHHLCARGVRRFIFTGQSDKPVKRFPFGKSRS